MKAAYVKALADPTTRMSVLRRMRLALAAATPPTPPRTAMKPQTIFNRVYKHLLTQKKKSEDETMCLYREESGLKCAVGALIPNKLYGLHLEGAGITDLFIRSPEIKELLGVENRELLENLQSVHDDNKPSRWGAALRKVAKQRGLKVPKPIAKAA